MDGPEMYPLQYAAKMTPQWSSTVSLMTASPMANVHRECSSGVQHMGFGGGETLTAQATSPVIAEGSVSVTCDGPAGYNYNRWTYRQAAGSTASRTYRLPAAARGGKCQFSVSASAENPAGSGGTTGPYLPEPEYPTGSKTSAKGTEAVVRVLVTSLR